MQVAEIETILRQIPTNNTQHPGFSSFKTSRPIPYAARWHRDLLIQATLDPAIHEIDYEHPTEGNRDSLNLRLKADGTVIQVTAVRDPVGSPPNTTLDGGMILRRSIVLTEPRASDARAVWATRRLPLQIGDRLRVLLAVEDGERHRMSDLVPSIRDRGYDPFEAILSLVCRGDLTIDLRGGLQPDTCVMRSKRRVRERPTD